MTETTDIDDLLAMDKRELMDEVALLRAAIISVQRSAFYAGFDAGQDGGIRAWAYEAWAE